MVGHRDDAVLAADHLAAGPAEHHRRETAPVQKQNALLAGGQRRAQRLRQRCRQQTVGAGRMAAQVDDGHLGERPRRRPFGERQAHEPAARDVVRALQRRRGRAEDRQRAGVLRADQRQIAPVVAHAFFLLERGIVLLVDDHHAERPHRREHRGARAERDANLARTETPPGGEALARRQPAVQHRHVLAEAGPESRGELRRQGDLWHQHQGALPGRARRRDDLQVDLRLPGAGHAVQEKAGEPTPERAAERGHRRGLRRVQREDRRSGRKCGRCRCLPLGGLAGARPAPARPSTAPAGASARWPSATRPADRRRRPPRSWPSSSAGPPPAWAAPFPSRPRGLSRSPAPASAPAAGARPRRPSRPGRSRPGAATVRARGAPAGRDAPAEARRPRPPARPTPGRVPRPPPGSPADRAPAGRARSAGPRAWRSPAPPAAAPRAAPRRGGPGSSRRSSGRRRSSLCQRPARPPPPLRCRAARSRPRAPPLRARRRIP